MISFLNHHKNIAVIILNLLLVVARACGVKAQILDHARSLQKDRQIEYALGFTIWFLLYRLGLKVPKYNIYHLIPIGEKQLYLDLLKTDLDDYRIEKQYFLLQSENEIDEHFRSRISDRLESSLKAPRKNTSQKIQKFDTTLAFDTLCKIDSVLKSEGLRPFLVSGTLLGAIRENGLIEGDNDLDLGIMSDDVTGEQVFNLLVNNTKFQSVYDLGHLIRITDNNGTVVDIFMHYRENGQIWHGTGLHKWANTTFQLKEMDLRSHTFLIPDNPGLYLDENYGNWANPVLFWDYVFDTPNHQFLANKKTIYFLVDRIRDELAKVTPSRYTVQTALDELNRRFDIDLTHYLGTKPAVESKENEKVVITFGTFDLFHIGHLNILQRAASHGDRLIVGVSSDALNFSKKATYPVYCEEDRIKIVSAIAGVNEVFLEESLERKEEYIRQYDADILLMGEDWKGKFDYLSDICDVIYLTRTENISTSETKDAIKRNL